MSKNRLFFILEVLSTEGELLYDVEIDDWFYTSKKNNNNNKYCTVFITQNFKFVSLKSAFYKSVITITQELLYQIIL